jgi:hypothetical protein
MIQILRVEHNSSVFQLLQARIKQYDAFHRNHQKKGGNDAIDPETTSRVHLGPDLNEISGTGHVTALGSPRSTRAIKDVLKEHREDTAFQSFCRRITEVIQGLNRSSSSTIPTINDLHQVL